MSMATVQQRRAEREYAGRARAMVAESIRAKYHGSHEPAPVAVEEPAVLYGLLTAADVRELARRNRITGRRYPLLMLCDC